MIVRASCRADFGVHDTARRLNKEKKEGKQNTEHELKGGLLSIGETQDVMIGDGTVLNCNLYKLDLNHQGGKQKIPRRDVKNEVQWSYINQAASDEPLFHQIAPTNPGPSFPAASVGHVLADLRPHVRRIRCKP